MPPRPRFHSDEPTLEDHLGHAPLVESVAGLIDGCQAPYVLGVHGDWGSGKTSFLQKLHLYLAGSATGRPNAHRIGNRLWPESYRNSRPYETIWFEAWRYQFEANPVVALLEEIRAHFTWSRKLVGEAAKLSFTALMSLEELTKKIGLQPSKIVEAGEQWEARQAAQPLPSQLYRQLLEEAIRTLLGGDQKKGKRLVVFIDDLDRCQGPVAFRLLEALKIYFSIPSCIFVLGLDERNVRRAVAAELDKGGLIPRGRKEEESNPAREIYASDYLHKIFQMVHHLPQPTRPETYLQALLTGNEFDDPREWIRRICDAKLLPPNPRKIKSFVNGLALYLQQLRPFLAAKDPQLDPDLALIVHYLRALANDVYRILAADPDFWSPLAEFCRSGQHFDHPVLRHRTQLERASALEGEETGFRYDPAFPDPADERLFRVAGLIRRRPSAPTTDELAAYFLRES